MFSVTDRPVTVTEYNYLFHCWLLDRAPAKNFHRCAPETLQNLTRTLRNQALAEDRFEEGEETVRSAFWTQVGERLTRQTVSPDRVPRENSPDSEDQT